MSGNPMLDRQIAAAVMPQFDMNQAIQQMQRPPVPMQVQNPIFGGTIPMDFGLPQASQIPAQFTPRAAQFRPGPVAAPAPAPGADVLSFLTGGMFDGYGSPGTVQGGGNQN
jgi:hypothetical protein